jgi:hypothetical protein
MTPACLCGHSALEHDAGLACELCHCPYFAWEGDE